MSHHLNKYNEYVVSVSNAMYTKSVKKKSKSTQKEIAGNY